MVFSISLRLDFYKSDSILIKSIFLLFLSIFIGNRFGRMLSDWDMSDDYSVEIRKYLKIE